MTAEHAYTVFFWLCGLALLFAWISLMQRRKESNAEPLIDFDSARVRLNQLNGWHRLGLCLVLAWSVIIGVEFIEQWGQINASYARYIGQSTSQPVNTGLPYVRLRRRAGAELLFESRSKDRGGLIQLTLFRWLVPIASMYVVAYGAVWVRDGFRR